MKQAVIGIIMGSTSDWPTMKEAAVVLDEFGIAWESQVVSAHRTPEKLRTYSNDAKKRGIKIIIAGAGGAAHLPGMCAAQTPLPVIGVPVESRVLKGVDSLLSIVQMPYGVPVATMSIGLAGAKNSALFALRMLAINDSELAEKLDTFIKNQEEKVLQATLEAP